MAISAVLAALLVVGPMDRLQQYPSDRMRLWLEAHLEPLLSIVIPYPEEQGGCPRRLMCRAEYIVATWQIVQILNEQFASKRTWWTKYLDDDVVRERITKDFWRLSVLVKTFRDDLSSIGYDYNSLVEMVEREKRGFEALGIEVRDPLKEISPDVASSCLVDQENHELFRAGMRYGTPRAGSPTSLNPRTSRSTNLR